MTEFELSSPNVRRKRNLPQAAAKVIRAVMISLRCNEFSNFHVMPF